MNYKEICFVNWLIDCKLGGVISKAHERCFFMHFWTNTCAGSLMECNNRRMKISILSSIIPNSSTSLCNALSCLSFSLLPCHTPMARTKYTSMHSTRSIYLFLQFRLGQVRTHRHRVDTSTFGPIGPDFGINTNVSCT